MGTTRQHVGVFTQNRNDLTFKIRYIPRVQAVYTALKAEVADVPDMEVSQSRYAHL